MSWFPFGGKSDVYLALDIGTEVVKALVFRINRDEKRAEVIGRKGPAETGEYAERRGFGHFRSRAFFA